MTIGDTSTYAADEQQLYAALQQWSQEDDVQAVLLTAPRVTVASWQATVDPQLVGHLAQRVQDVLADRLPLRARDPERLGQLPGFDELVRRIESFPKLPQGLPELLRTRAADRRFEFDVERVAFALVGGAIMGYGARLARGCTSGLALSGGAVLSVGAWVFMLAIFGGEAVGNRTEAVVISNQYERAYYDSVYDGDNKSPPTCYSRDGDGPHAQAHAPQSKDCEGCLHNQFGSASNGIGVERTFLLRSPRLDKIVVERHGKVRRAQLYYMRERTGKSARIKEKFS